MATATAHPRTFTLAEFVGFWEMSPTVQFAAESLGITPTDCFTLACDLRAEGLKLRKVRTGTADDAPHRDIIWVRPRTGKRQRVRT